MNNDDIKFLLVRYITGQCNDAEIKHVKHWVDQHPENELYFIELYDTWQNMLSIKSDIINENKAYRLLLDKIALVKPKRTMRWLRVAALLLLILIPPSILLLYTYHKPVVKKMVVVTKKGTLKQLLLSDGTSVWLNAGSTLTYNAEFNKSNRTVYLEGEAFFIVGHPKSKIPFLVNTKKYTIRDIGTKFNLKAYANDPFFETTVISGMVAVDSKSGNNSNEVNRIFVKPRQVLRMYYHPLEIKPNTDLTAATASSYNEASMMQLDSSKLNIYDGWKDDVLVFDSSTLQDMAKVLERRYNVTIAINAPVLQQIRYSGSFKGIADIKDVLELIKTNTPIAYRINGRNITITNIN